MSSLVSVIVPVLNAEKTVARCVESLLAQTWRDLEIIAVDGGSTDGSAAVLRACIPNTGNSIIWIFLKAANQKFQKNN